MTGVPIIVVAGPRGNTRANGSEVPRADIMLVRTAWRESGRPSRPPVPILRRPRSGAPADLDGDGVGGVTDLIMLITGWGPCEAPCPPSCVADIDGDCEVGVTDLVVLIGS